MTKSETFWCMREKDTNGNWYWVKYETFWCVREKVYGKGNWRWLPWTVSHRRQEALNKWWRGRNFATEADGRRGWRFERRKGWVACCRVEIRQVQRK